MSVSMSYTLKVNGSVADCYGVARMWEAELQAQDPRLKTVPLSVCRWQDKSGVWRSLDSLPDTDVYEDKNYEHFKNWPMSLDMSVHDRYAYGVNTEATVAKIVEQFPNTILTYSDFFPQENETIRVFSGGKEVAILKIGGEPY